MKSLGFLKTNSLENFDIKEYDTPEPILRDDDALVKIKAIGFNPIDYKIRQMKNSVDGIKTSCFRLGRFRRDCKIR